MRKLLTPAANLPTAVVLVAVEIGQDGEMRSLLIAALLSGCSLGIKQVDPRYDGTTEPDCDDSYTMPLLDFIASGVAFGVAAAAGNNGGVVVAGLGAGLVEDTIAIIGATHINKCRTAEAAWQTGGAIRAGDAAQEAAALAKAHPDLVDKPMPPPAQVPPPTPRGFFCASNATTGLCAREKADCQSARDAAIGAVPDLGECTLVENAWCSGDRCLPTKDACTAAQQRAGSGAPECAESK